MISFQINKKNLLIHQFIVVLMTYSFILSIYYLTHTHNLQRILYPFITNRKEPIAQYMLVSAIYIFIQIVASSSYLGIVVISLSMTYRILCMTYSFTLMNAYSIHSILILIIETAIELLVTYIMAYMSIQLTFQMVKLTFIKKNNFQIKVLINYILSYTLIAFILVFINCLLRIYLL